MSEDALAVQRLRRAAEKQGLVVRRSHRRDRTAPDYGTFRILHGPTDRLIAERLTLAEVRRYLRDRVLPTREPP